MKRRTALKALGGALIASAIDQRVLAAGKDVKWKTAIGLNGFSSASRKYKKTFPIWEVLDFAHRVGFDGIELVAGWPMGGYPAANEVERVAALKRLYDAFGLQIFSIQLGAGGAFAPDAKVRKRWLDEIADRAAFAKAVGCECIGLWPGGGLRGQPLDEAIDRLAESFRQVGKITAELGLLAAFEIEPPFVFNTEEHVHAILAKVNHPNFKAIYDPSHYDLMSGSTGRPHEMLRRVGVDNIGYIHFTDTDGTLREGGTSKHLPCGDGHIDVARSLQVLREGGFNGWVMIDAWEITDPYDAGRKGLAAIRAALA